MTARAIIEEIAAEVGGTFSADYSGRNMYGAQCCAIDCGDYLDVIEQAVRHGIARPKIDQLGKGFIAYWEDSK